MRAAYVSIRQHTSAIVAGAVANVLAMHAAYVSLRQHTSAYVMLYVLHCKCMLCVCSANLCFVFALRKFMLCVCIANVCFVSAHVVQRMLTYADVC